MTREVFGPAPHSGDDPLSAAHVTPLVVYLASPAAEAITGRVLSVYGDRIDVMSAPAVEASLRTPHGGSTKNCPSSSAGTSVRPRLWRSPKRLECRRDRLLGRADEPDDMTEGQRRRRRQLTTAVIEMLAETGPDGIQMREVSERSGVAMGTLYRYFPAKEHLLAAAMVAWNDILAERLEDERRSGRGAAFTGRSSSG